jgi:hypothetical protein
MPVPVVVGRIQKRDGQFDGASNGLAFNRDGDQSGRRPIRPVAPRSHVVSNQAGFAEDMPRLTSTDRVSNLDRRVTSTSVGALNRPMAP